MQENPSPLAMSVKQAVTFVNLSRSELYRRMADGRLPAFKCGRRTMLRVADLERLIGDLPQKQTPPRRS
jgi:excisionase family DNA binding protein